MNLSVATVQRRLMRRSPLLVMLGAVLFILALLPAFHYVVSDGKRQAELRHKAIALRAAALWRCQGESAKATRNQCMAQLQAAESVSQAQ